MLLRKIRYFSYLISRINFALSRPCLALSCTCKKRKQSRDEECFIRRYMKNLSEKFLVKILAIRAPELFGLLHQWTWEYLLFPLMKSKTYECVFPTRDEGILQDKKTFFKFPFLVDESTFVT